MRYGAILLAIAAAAAPGALAAQRTAFGAYLPTVSASAGSSVGETSELGSSPVLATSGIGESYTTRAELEALAGREL